MRRDANQASSPAATTTTIATMLTISVVDANMVSPHLWILLFCTNSGALTSLHAYPKEGRERLARLLTMGRGRVIYVTLCRRFMRALPTCTNPNRANKFTTS